MNVSHFVRRCLDLPPTENPADSPAWREELLRTILFFILGFGFLTALPSIALAIRNDEGVHALVDVVALAAVSYLTFSRRLRYTLRAVGLVVISYGFGTYYLVAAGMTTQIYLLGVAVLAALLLGMRAGLIGLGFSASTLLIGGYLAESGVWPPYLEPDVFTSWLILALNFIFVAGVLTVSAAALLGRLEGSYDKQRAIAVSLEEGRASLQLALDGLATEVQNRQLAQDETRRLAMAIEQANDVVLISDAAGAIVYANSAYDDLVERIGPSISVGHLRDLPTGGPEGGAVSIAAAIVRDDSWVGTVAAADAAGRPHILETVITPLLDDAGRTVNRVAVLRDVTVERQMEARLRRSEKLEALGTLATGTAHDFNNIIGSILAVAEFTLDDVRNTPMAPNLQSIITACNRARDIVRQMMVFGQQSNLTRRPTSVRRVVEEALPLIRAAAPSSIEVRPILTSDGVVEADPGEIHQILMNLAANAVHAMVQGGGGVLTIELEERPLPSVPSAGSAQRSLLCLTVRDTGRGIEPAVLERIFDPFFTTKQVEGMGLGLASVHGVVRSLNGDIEVSSIVGEGSTFRVLLPAVTPASRQRAAVVEDVHAGVGTILLVDDEETILSLMTTYLSGLGYRVLAHGDGLRARDSFDADPRGIDLVVTDLTMPGFSGAQLIRHVHEQRPALPVVLTSGYAQMSDAEALSSLHLSGYLQKPYSLRDLAVLVHATLAREPGE